MNDRIQVSIAATPHANVTGDIAVRLDGVAKSFNNTPALHEVSLQIRQGEFLTLLGPSGCG
jgi:putative spermidine/putrescine transport system ATP-binding protein